LPPKAAKILKSGKGKRVLRFSFFEMITTEIISKTKPADPYPSQVNQNSNWVNFRGAWITNFILLAFLRAFMSVIPGISTEIAWTLTNILYLTGHFIMFHMLVGTPFDTDHGEFDGLTLWEQMDNGLSSHRARSFSPHYRLSFSS